MSRGGVRYGAGRPARHRKTGAALQVDVRRLQRDGRLAGDYRLEWRWSNGANIDLDTCADAVTLRYRWGGDEGTEIAKRVPVIRTPCHYGGSRPWFACPYCGRRCAILYLMKWPKCRRCAGLVYRSQSEDAIGRSWSRTARILRRLGQGGDYPHGVPRRPAGMRTATWERLWAAWCREEEYRDGLLAAFVARLAPEIRRCQGAR